MTRSQEHVQVQLEVKRSKVHRHTPHTNFSLACSSELPGPTASLLKICDCLSSKVEGQLALHKVRWQNKSQSLLAHISPRTPATISGLQNTRTVKKVCIICIRRLANYCTDNLQLFLDARPNYVIPTILCLHRSRLQVRKI
jgi:hypothetical protein